MKKMLKLSLVILAIISISTFAFAKNPTELSGKITGTSAFDNIGGKIIGGVQSIGTIASVVVLIILGLKYMMGSTEEKAEYKKTMIPYIIGAVVVFAASNIASMVFNFASGIS